MTKQKVRLVCVQCGNKISVSSFRKRKLCFPCAMKLQRGPNSAVWKGGKEHCIDCGKQLKVVVGKSVTKRCRECYDIFRVERDKHTVCVNCGDEVSYCSRSKLCRTCWLLENGDKQTIKYACAVCGKERSFYAKVCSDCFIHPSGSNHPNWKGGKATYSGLWDKNKIIALKRDNYTCQICFKRGGNLDVHHIKFMSEFTAKENDKAHDLSNLITLCRGCHNHLHGKDIDEVLRTKKRAK